MKIAVMGAGAVGCYYGGMLARAGNEVVLIGRPNHVDAIRQNGLRFEAQSFDEIVRLHASTDPAAVAGAEVILFSVKSTDTESAALSIKPHLRQDAFVLSLQNGIDNAERLRAVLPQEVAATVVYVAAEMAGAGHVRHHGRGELVIEPSAAATRVADLFRAAHMPVQVSANVQSALWTKLVANCTFNALSAITRLPYGPLAAGAGMRDTMLAIANECAAVARAEGVALPDDLDGTAIQPIIDTMPGQYSSTAQDLMRGRPTEIDYLNGAVARRGARLGVPTPLNAMLCALVKLLEQRPA